MIVMPTIIEKSPTGQERWIDIPSKLFSQRIILLTDEVNDYSANIIISEMLYLDSQSTEDINLIINSSGGSVLHGLGILDCMNNLKSKVNTICYGHAASMGALLLSSGTGVRKASKESRIMLHPVSGGTGGTVYDMSIDHQETLYLQKRLNEILAKNTNQKVSKIKKDFQRDAWMSAEEAVKYGLIDEVL
jgi:ATP-dependent Clp protease protease subunit